MNQNLQILWLEEHANPSVKRMLSNASDEQLHKLKDALHPLDAIAMQKLCGVLNIKPIDCFDHILNAAGNVPDFEFYPDVTTERELPLDVGQAINRNFVEGQIYSGIMDFPENVRDYLDYARIGIEYHANHSGAFIDAGYVTRQQESEQSFGMQMV